MTDSKSRKSVRKFFYFALNQDRLRWKPVRIKFVLVPLILGFTSGLVNDVINSSWPDSTLLWSILSFGLAISLDRSWAWFDLSWRKARKEKNNQEFAELSHVVRRVQAEDWKKATLRIFERCHQDRSELRVLQNQYHDEQSGLFDVETPDKVLEDLRNKSSTFRSFPNKNGDRMRWIRWSDLNRSEAFFNPVRIVSLYFTNTQIIICDVTIDSINGDLQEDMLRIAFSDVVSVTSTNRRTRKELTFENDEEKQIALDHGLSEEEIHEIRQKRLKGVEAQEWCLQTIISELKISRTDGGFQALPIRYKTDFGVGESALDEDALTADERTIDGMVNELNRMIEASKSTKPG